MNPDVQAVDVQPSDELLSSTSCSILESGLRKVDWTWSSLEYANLQDASETQWLKSATSECFNSNHGHIWLHETKRGQVDF